MLASALAATLLAAQVPSVFVNAQLQPGTGAAGLEAAVTRLLGSRPQPAWIAWAVPGPARHACRFESVDADEASGRCCGGCRLEGRGPLNANLGGSEPVRLERPRRTHVLLRVQDGRVGRVGTYSEDCALDVGGLPLHWLADVRSAESVALLAGLASSPPRLPLAPGFDAEAAVMAVAQHDDAAADTALARLASSGPLDSRKRAVFWLGEARGRPGYEALVRLLGIEKGAELREHAVFALSQSEVPEAVDAMIGVAKRDRSAEVRGKALFWLAQRAGQKAATAITEAIREDPETEVKQKAVFALSQLPSDQGVPLLIGLARSHRNPAVRERAIFWLGQSEDTRALAFFEEVLAR
jgi:HEAT repeats